MKSVEISLKRKRQRRKMESVGSDSKCQAREDGEMLNGKYLLRGGRVRSVETDDGKVKD